MEHVMTDLQVSCVVYMVSVSVQWPSISQEVVFISHVVGV